LHAKQLKPDIAPDIVICRSRFFTFHFGIQWNPQFKNCLPPRRQERQEEQRQKTFNVLKGFLGGLGVLAVKTLSIYSQSAIPAPGTA
jgi:hypothetical protein